MGFCDVSQINFDKSPCKMFLKNYDSSCNKNNINKVPLNWSVEKIKWWKTNIFTEPSNQIMWFLQASTTQNFSVLDTTVFN